MDEALLVEVQEFAELTGPGIDPGTGEPFAGVEELIREAMAYNIARPNEVFLGYVNGSYLTKSPQQPGTPDVLAGHHGRTRWDVLAAGGHQRFAGPAAVLAEDVGDVPGAHRAAGLHSDVGQPQIVHAGPTFTDRRCQNVLGMRPEEQCQGIDSHGSSLLTSNELLVRPG